MWEEDRQEWTRLRTANEELHVKINKVETENKNLSTRVRILEDKLMEGNVVLQGIPDSLWEPGETTKEKVLTAIAHTIGGENFEEKMDQARKIPIKDIARIGRYSAMRMRAVLVEFYYKSDALYLLGNRTHLPNGVFIDRQYSDKTERERRKLRPILKAARNNNKYRGKCRMDGATLVIKGRNYTSDNLHDLPTDINRYSATSKISEEHNVIGFFGELNPLSNFHPTPFTIHGQKYHSTEQFIQQQKCIVFGDKESEAAIMTTKTALECKIISREIKNFDHERWKQIAKASLYSGYSCQV